MGQNQSANTTNEQDINNNISEISNEKCIQSIEDSSAIKVDVINSTIGGDVDISRVLMINGVSCNLKSSLDAQLINTQANFQDLNLKDLNKEDPLNTLAQEAQDITPYGAAVDAFKSLLGKNQTINESNIEKTTNQVTQQMNSMCQNKIATQNAPILANFDNSKIKGNVKVSDSQQISNTSCTIANMAKTYVKNDQSNTQKGAITNLQADGAIGAIIAIILGICIIVVVGGMIAKGFMKKPAPPPQSSTSKNPSATGSTPPSTTSTPPSTSQAKPPVPAAK
jgi:hypothetical protein